MAFYSALHWVDAFLARSSVHPQSHTERDTYVWRSQLRTIYDQYRTLSDRSREARYDVRAFADDEARMLLSDELTDVRAHARSLLQL